MSRCATPLEIFLRQTPRSFSSLLTSLLAKQRLWRPGRAAGATALLAYAAYAAFITVTWQPAHAQYPPPSGKSHWKLTVSYSGTVNQTCTSTYPYSGVGVPQTNVQNQHLPISSSGPSGSGSLDISTLSNSPGTSETGGITAHLNVNSTEPASNGTGTGSLSMSGCQVTVNVDWVHADPFLPQNDPAPDQVFILYRRTAVAGASARTSVGGDSADIITSCQVDGVTAGPSAHASNGSTDTPTPTTNQEAAFTCIPLTATSGHASKTFTIVMTDGTTVVGNNGNASSTFEGDAYVDFCVQGFSMSRFASHANGVGRIIDGHTDIHAFDPTFTRWLPLAFSPAMNSQAFRLQSGALPAPWGNVNCMYSTQVAVEPANPNLDLNGTGLVLLSPGFSGTTAGVPMRNTAGGGALTVVTDANGDRIVVDSSDVHSTITHNGNGTWTISGAGPPGSMRQAGIYTYNFEATGNPGTRGRLLSISDIFGNQQTLSWGTGLTVADSSSGRSLIFNGTGGYFTSVDAPASGSLPGTRATLGFDGGGHLTSLAVMLLGTSTVVRQDTFTYGDGSNPDAITGTTQGLASTTYGYTADTGAADPFGVAAPRLTSATYGSPSDTSSSDDGYSVQGTWSYTYGWLTTPYNDWGQGLRTNTSTDANGNQTKYIYSFGGNAISSILSGAIKYLQVTSPGYTGSGASTRITSVAWSPDILSPTQVNVTDSLGLQWTANLTTQGNVSSLVDPLANQWQFGYSTDGKDLTSVSDPTSLLWQLGYANNHLTSVTDPGNATRLTAIYNTFGQPASVTVPAGVSASGIAETMGFTYDATKGDLTTVTDPLSNIFTIGSYDALGDPLSFSVYPDTGNPATSTNPLTTTLNYDASQMPILVALPGGTQFVPTYNNAIPTRFDVKNQGVTKASLILSTDSRGRLYSVSDLVGSLAQYRFDKNSSVTRVLDGRGNTASIGRGPNNEITSLGWPGGGGPLFSYDAAGQIKQVTDERSIAATPLFDTAGRMTDIRFPAYSSQNVHAAYDAAGRATSITDATGSTTFTYDATRKRLQTVTTVLGGRTYTVSYTYFGDGKIQSMTSPAGTTNYAYDANGRMTSMTTPASELTTWSYDHIGRITNETTTTTASKNVSSTYAWGISGQGGDPSTLPVYPRTLTETVGGIAFETYTLTHSYLGQLLSQSGTGDSSETFSYGFDNRGRITSAAQSLTSGGNNYSATGSYSWDLANNLQGGASGWTYNTNNQVTTAASLGGLSGATGLGYDSGGHLTTASGMTLSYDCWGRLSGVTGAPGGSPTYTYDWAGRRVSKTLGGVTTYYLYAGGGLLLCELDSSGSVLRSYNWGAQGLVSDRASGTSRYYLFDKNGNTRALVNASGTVLGRGAYTPWGSPVNAALTPGTSFGWRGRYGAYLDSETGLILMGWRYYAPSLGRFITRDPSGFSCGPNLYAYCFGDPIDFFDADGLRGETILQALNGYTPWGMAYRMGSGLYNDPKGFLINMIPFVGLYHADEAFGYTYGMWESGKASAGDLLDAGLGCAAANAGTGMMMFGGVSAVTGGGGAAEVGAGTQPYNVYMRVVSAEEADIIRNGPGAVASLSAKGGFGDATRLFTPDKWGRMQPFFANNPLYGDNPQVIHFVTEGPLAPLGTDATGLTSYFRVGDINAALHGVNIIPYNFYP